MSLSNWEYRVLFVTGIYDGNNKFNYLDKSVDVPEEIQSLCLSENWISSKNEYLEYIQNLEDVYKFDFLCLN
jgi:hypothetical protein